MKAGRNDPCPCGSGKKYKKCCELAGAAAPSIQSAYSNSNAVAGQVRPPTEDVAPTELNRLATLFGAGEYQELERRASRLSKQHPKSAVVWQILGLALKALGKDALPTLQKSIELMPNDPGAHNNLGTVFQEARRFEEAAASYQRAVDLKPDFAEAHCNLGNSFKDMRRFDDAVLSYNKAVKLKANFAVAHNQLSIVLQLLGRFDEAVISSHRALEIQSNFRDAHSNLGCALLSLERPEEAIASFCRAIEIQPDYATGHYNIGNALKALGQLDEAVASYRQALKIEPSFPAARDNLAMTLLYIPHISRQEVFLEHRYFGEEFEPPLKPQWAQHGNARDEHKRLKIGYVSGDLRKHAVAYFLEPLFTNHDKSAFEIFCYANSDEIDAETHRLMALSDHWLQCSALTEEQLAQQITEDGIDILVDLSGHTARNRLLTFARKPAPIQITYLGYPGSTGLTAMDYRLTDHHTEPEQGTAGEVADAYYTERLWRLPNSLWCYRPSDDMPDVTPLPAETNGFLTLGSFNDVNKIGAECIELWSSVLRNLSTARLVMATVPEGSMRSRLISAFQEQGIDRSRIDFLGKLPIDEFRRKLQEVDISLDPFPINGATTTCESLWLGVPVLGIAGDRFLTRAGLSILNAAGMAEFIAATPDEFVQKLTTLSNDLPRLAAIRSGMRDKLRTSPLLDQELFTRNLESAYRQMWHNYLAN